MMPYRPYKVLYTTSKPGKPASADYFGLLKDAKIPIQPAASLEQLASESDVLFVCCALTPETKNAVDAQFLGRMKPTAVIVNTARGPIIDSDALAAALKEGRLLGAGLDVLTGEPGMYARVHSSRLS
jgi:glyoxylate/hydroxypyruvate reductase